MKDGLTLSVVTVSESKKALPCDCVLLPIAEDSKGRFSGSYGIRHGHARAVFALGEGIVTAKQEGRTVYSAFISGGFATVEKDLVTITADSAQEQ